MTFCASLLTTIFLACLFCDTISCAFTALAIPSPSVLGNLDKWKHATELKPCECKLTFTLSALTTPWLLLRK
uniref:Secreted protein n=1 Tax=Arundo donax TaxID=35708 RepID=A0A0A9DC72_ARUDO